MIYKKVIRFIFIFVITYTILFFPWSGFRKAYTKCIETTGQALFHRTDDNGIVFLWPKPKDPLVLKVLISKTDMHTGTSYYGSEYDFNVKISGVFLTVVFFLSLVAATTISWRRKFFALFGGFFILLCYAMLKMKSIILFSYTQNPKMGLFQGVSEKETIDFWYNHFAMKSTIDYTFALVLWIILCMGKKEWQQLSVAFLNDKQTKKPIQK